jgi:glucose dehydrogenase
MPVAAITPGGRSAGGRATQIWRSLVLARLFGRGHGSLDALDASERYDVCIIGSGFSGTVLGTELVKAGLRTVILESGYGLASWVLDSRVRGLADYEVSGNAAYPTKRTKARMVGGNSNLWAGRCERLHPSDFAHHPYLPKSNPWPIDYRDLEPYYERAEVTLRVRGGEQSRYMAPRSGPLPLSASSGLSRVHQLFRAIGVTVDVPPTATPRKAFRFFRVQEEILPEFLVSPCGALVCGVTVTRLLADGDRRIIGAEVKTLDGATRTIRARLFVVASGGIETPRLLLSSRSEAFPYGVGNDHDRVGRGFIEHVLINFYARVRRSRGALQPRHEIGRIYQFYETLRVDGLGSIRIAVILSRMFLHRHLPPATMLREAARALGGIGGAMLYLGPHIEMKPVDENRVTLSTTRRDHFGNPLARLHLSFSEEDQRSFDGARAIVMDMFDHLGADAIREGPVTFSRHHIGTCRMGTDPRTSVVDPELRVHGTPNLYVLGSATFVTGGAVPPTLTIVALAHRLAGRLVRMMREGSAARTERLIT